MFVLVVGNFKLSDAIEVIKEELNRKETTPVATIKEDNAISLSDSNLINPSLASNIFIIKPLR